MKKKVLVVFGTRPEAIKMAPCLGLPVLVMRETTERLEALEAGTVSLVGANRALIVSKVNELLDNENVYQKISKANNPFGDGTTANKIVEQILNL